jgi:hypothetical protein
MKTVMTHLMASKDSKETMSGIVSLLGGFVGAKITGSLQNSNWMAVLTGQESASPKVLQVAKTVLSMQENPEMFDSVLTLGTQWLETQGYEIQKVLKMAVDYAPALGIKVAEPSIPALRDGLFALAHRVVESSDDVHVSAFVTCPYCDSLFAV